MAEIKIEKKKAIWPWIIGIIILGLLIYFLAFNKDNKETETDKATTEELTQVNVNHSDETTLIAEVLY